MHVCWSEIIVNCMQDQESDGQAVKGITESAGKVTKGKNKRAPVQMGMAGQGMTGTHAEVSE
jgi:hypothetical protein